MDGWTDGGMDGWTDGQDFEGSSRDSKASTTRPLTAKLNG